MKLKLKVSKSLKRDLKLKAVKVDQERTEFILKHLLDHIESNDQIWSGKIEAYLEILKERDLGLIALKESFTEETLLEDQRHALKAYYADHKMYRHIISKQKKLENIILTLNDESYYALRMMAEEKEMPIEAYTLQYLHTLNNHV